MPAKPAPKLHQAKPTGWTKKEVQAFAAKIAEDLGYKPGDDLEAIVCRLGGRVTTSDWESARETGSITVRSPNDFEISLSPLSGNRRSRFTVAHELAHYILHSKMGATPLTVQRDGSGQVEWEANWFAAGFLMPEKEFRQKVTAGWGDAEIAEHFDVSEAAVQIRRQSF